MDTNLCFKMLLQAVGMEIPFDMARDNFLFKTINIFIVTQEVHSGVLIDSQDIGIQVLGRILQAYMNFHQPILLIDFLSHKL